MADKTNLEASLERIEASIEASADSLEDLNNKALKGGLGFNELLKAVDSTVASVDVLTKGIGSLGSALTLGLDMGGISKSFGALGGIFKTVMGGAVKLAGILDGMGQAIDSVTGYSRDLNADMYESVAAFNGSFAAAKEFSEYIMKSSQQFASAEFGWISPADTIEATNALMAAGISVENLGDIVQSSAGKMDLLNTSILHSQSLGMSLSKYSDMISDSILKQGLTTQEAAEQMAMFGDASKNTGLRVDKVSDSLQRTANNFSKLGLTASFGQPILEGFSDTLKDMGLGFENAIDLSEKLSNALVGLGSNYASAYLTFQKGGLDMGGGGAIGASIDLRASLADQGADQGQMAVEMAGAMKDTIASFTGGQIITLDEAGDDDSLKTAFYTQTKLLEKLYGISDTGDQDRTLDLLSQLGDATAAGNTDLAASLGSDLQDAMAGRDGTLSYEEKTAKFTEATWAELQLTNKVLIEGFRLSGDTLTGLMTDFQSKALDTAEPEMKRLNAGNAEDKVFDFRAAGTSISNNVESGMKALEGKIEGLNVAQSLVTALGGITMDVNDSEGNTAIGDLAGEIRSLVSTLTQLMNGREGSPAKGS
jgi:hypothetical protein